MSIYEGPVPLLVLPPDLPLPLFLPLPFPVPVPLAPIGGHPLCETGETVGLTVANFARTCASSVRMLFMLFCILFVIELLFIWLFAVVYMMSMRSKITKVVMSIRSRGIKEN